MDTTEDDITQVQADTNQQAHQPDDMDTISDEVKKIDLDESNPNQHSDCSGSSTSNQHADLPLEIKTHRDYDINKVLNNVFNPVRTKGQLNRVISNSPFVSLLEPKKFEDAEGDDSWMLVMQEELDQFK